MKNAMLITAAVLCNVAAGVADLASAAEEIPVYPLLNARQKAFLDMPREERVAAYSNQTFRSELRKNAGYFPVPVKLELKTSGEKRVVVKRLPDGKVFFDETTTNLTVEVWNLEIARTWEWSAGPEHGKFKTEDRAPRLIRAFTVPNVRDLGGRIGLDGRRVKQGMIIRSAGLNNNASRKYLSLDELAKKRAVTDEDRVKWEKAQAELPGLEARLKQLVDWQKNPGTFNLEDRDYQGWIKRHKGAKNEYLKARVQKWTEKVARAKAPFEYVTAGKSRINDKNRALFLDYLGIRTDLDLRTDIECRLMTGSPLGPTVKWVHVPSSAYHGMAASCKTSFKKDFATFLDEKNYPVDFHCIAGQDRTGSLAFVLNGLLGVREEDLWLDWETTAFWNGGAGFSHARLFFKLLPVFDKFPGATLTERIETYVKASGFTDADIAKFREIMLERD